MDAGNESPPSRTTILSSFLRSRPRNTSQSHVNSDNQGHGRELSPSPPPLSNAPPSHRRSRIITSNIQPIAPSIVAVSTTTASPGLGLSHMLRRRRSAGNIINSNNPSLLHMTQPIQSSATTAANTPSSSNNPASRALSTSTPVVVHRIRLVPHIEGRRSLRFDAIPRDLREGDSPIRIGRFTDRSGIGLAAVNAPGSNKLAFRSKVVSRAHAELWVESGPHFYIKDTRSSSGTFLNNSRLSPANVESRPFQMRDGDILQLGVDYQGGTEDIYKSVKIRVEIGREWQAVPNAFNTNALKQIKSLVPAIKSSPNNGVDSINKPAGKSSLNDCCICLSGVTIHQALFIAPCSHSFHYKCIRPYLESHHPSFCCPLCRTYADLEEDVEIESVDNADAAELSGLLGDSDAAEASVVASGQQEPDRRASSSVEGIDGEGDYESPSAPVSTSVPSGDFHSATTGSRTGTVRMHRNPHHEADRDRGAETEVEMDYLPNTQHHRPTGSGSSSPGMTIQPGSNSNVFLPFAGATLTGRVGGRVSVHNPAADPTTIITPPGRVSGRHRVEDDDDDEAIENQIQREMLCLRASDSDQDQMMADWMPGSSREAGEDVHEGSRVTPPPHIFLVPGNELAVGVDGVMEVDGPNPINAKRKR